MKLITVPRISVNELQTLAQSTLKITEVVPEVSVENAAVAIVLAKYLEGMVKDKAVAKGKKDKDNKRDSFLVGFADAVSAELKYPHEDSIMLNTLQKIDELVDKYGDSKVRRSKYNIESASVDNLVNELKQMDTDMLVGTGLTRWFPLIETANNDFKNLALAVNQKKSSAATSATEVYSELEDALNNLYLMVFSGIRYVNTPEIKDAYSQLTQLVNAHK